MDLITTNNENIIDELYETRYKLIEDIQNLIPGISFDLAASIYNDIATKKGV